MVNNNYIDREFSPSYAGVTFNLSSSPGSGAGGEFTYNHIKSKKCIYIMSSSSPSIENCLLENPYESGGSYLVRVSGEESEPVLRDDTLKGNYLIGVYTPGSRTDLGEFDGDENQPDNCCINDPDSLDDEGNNYFHYNEDLVYYIYVDVDSPACSGPDDPTARIPAEGNYWCEDYLPVPNDTFLVTWTVDIGTPSPEGVDGRKLSSDCCPPGGPKIVMQKSDILPKFEVNLYPTPFNNKLNISISLPEKDEVIMKVYNIMGREINEILNKELDKGRYNFSWNCKDFSNNDVSTGIYFINIRTDNLNIIKRVILLK